MNRAHLRRLINAELDSLLEALSVRQHLTPREPLSSALARMVDDLGVCPQAVQQAVSWLGVDPNISVGRLRRTELMQLARSIHRFWSQRRAESPAPQTAPQPGN